MIFALTSAGVLQVVHAQTLTADQTAVKGIIERVYSFDPDSFEYGRFDSKLRPFMMERAADVRGKYNPERHCALLRDFFDETIIKKSPISKGRFSCDLGVMGYVRFPTLGDEDHSSATRSIDIPKPKIDSPVITGNGAKIVVFTGDGKAVPVGRSLYFLTKGEQGWRITKFMVHRKWPDLDDKVHNCYFDMAREPSPEEAKEIPKHCR